MHSNVKKNEFLKNFHDNRNQLFP